MLLNILLFFAEISTVVGGGGGKDACVVGGVVTPELRHEEWRIKRIDCEISVLFLASTC